MREFKITETGYQVLAATVLGGYLQILRESGREEANRFYVELTYKTRNQLYDLELDGMTRADEDQLQRAMVKLSENRVPISLEAILDVNRLLPKYADKLVPEGLTEWLFYQGPGKKPYGEWNDRTFMFGDQGDTEKGYDSHPSGLDLVANNTFVGGRPNLFEVKESGSDIVELAVLYRNIFPLIPKDIHYKGGKIFGKKNEILFSQMLDRLHQEGKGARYELVTNPIREDVHMARYRKVE